MKILFFGDIVGKLGRRAVAATLPSWKKKYKPDIIIANAENLAHGKGVTSETIQELTDAGVHAFTSGNHIWDKPQVLEVIKDKKVILLRPANYPSGTPGEGWSIVTIGKNQLAIVNLQGRVFMHENIDDPFRKLDEVLVEIKKQTKDKIPIFVDFHAEATSEKTALGWYADGRVAIVVGTHTQVRSGDARLLLKGTAYQTDIGMSGARDGVIGVDREIIIKKFLTQRPAAHEIPEKGWAQVCATLVTIDAKTKLAKDIVPLYNEVEI